MPFAENQCPIELTLPADPNLMLVTRLTAAGVIAKAGITVDRMDELKMAVEEACGCMIDQPDAPARIALRFACDGGHLDIRVLALDDEAHAGTLTEDELEVMRCILDALVDEVAFDVRDGRIASVCMKAALSR